MATEQVPPNGNGSDLNTPVVLHADGQAMLTVPFGPMLLTASFTRQGEDLAIQGRGGEQVLIQNYFGTEAAMAPALVTEGGGRLTAEVVEALTGPSEEDRVAGAEGDATLIGQGAQPIGTVDTSEGEVYATRPDGSRVALKEGDPIFQGDVLETGDDGAVKITFVDKTEFALDQGARMVVDEMVYDAGSGDGKSAFTVVQGVFTFTSGMVAKAGPDAMQVHTPVATIGIRGTRVAIRAGAEGEDTVISLLQEEDGHTGEISITNETGTRVLNVANQTVFVESAFAAPTQPIVLPSEQLRAIFTRGNADDRGYWKGDSTAGEQQGNAAGLDGRIQQAKSAVADEGHDEKKLEGAEAAAEIAFELALAEGKDEKAALEEAEKAFKDSLIDGQGADALIQTAAGGETFSAGGDQPGADSGLEYDPSLGTGGVAPPIVTVAAPTTTTTTTGEPPPPTFTAGPAAAPTTAAGPITGTAGDDTLTGTTGDDVVQAIGGNDTVNAGEGNDVVSGGEGDDALVGGAGDDVVFGNEGDDLFLNAADNAGDDVYDGGAGNDTVTYASDSDGVFVNLQDGIATGPGVGQDTLIDIENATGGAGNDTLIGSEEANVLVGGAGDDTIVGGAGDTLDGGTGNDILRIAMTPAEFQDPAFLQELKDYRNREGDGPFTFESIGMTVENFEDLQIEVGGALVVADTPYLETFESGGDEDTAIPLNIQAALNDLEGGEELAVTLSGIPDGATITFNGQQITFTGEFNEVTFFATNQDQLDSLTLTPPQDFNGEIFLQVKATAIEVDGTFSEVSTDLAVTVNPVNDNPVAIEVIQSGAEDAGTLAGNLSASDVDGDNLTFAVDGADANGSVTTPTGTLTVNADGSYTFEPSGTVAVGEQVTENFTYTVTDGQGGTTTSTIAITITGTNNGPVAAEATVAGGEDDTLLTGNLTATDLDPGAELSFNLNGSGEGQYGSLTVNSDGSYAFVMGEAAQGLGAGETATETFTYTVTDDQGATSTAQITVTITGANDGPVAAAETVAGGEDAGVLSGNLTATDADANATLTFNLVGSGEGQYGTIAVNGDGSYSFAVGEAAQGLGAGEEITETFTYQVTDDQGEVSTATITVTITGTNDAPVASSASISGTEDAGTLSGNLVASDADQNAQLSYGLNGDGEGQYGTISVNSDGSYNFAVAESAQGLAAGQEVTETFTYTVTDEHGETSSAQITVTITGTNDNPVASSASVSGTEDAGVLNGNLVATDVDANAELTFSLAGSGEGDYGTIIVNEDGSYTFAISESAQGLGAGQQATETFTYTVTDEHGATSTAQITVTIAGTNDNPVAASASVSGSEEAGVLSGNLTATDADANADLTFALLGSGESQYGTLTVNSDGSYDFAIAEAAQGLAEGQEITETFTYQVTDDQGGTSMATITVTITGTNDAPVASSASVSGTEDAGVLSGNLVATDADENAELTFSVNGSGEGQYGALIVNSDGSYSFAISEAAQGLAAGQEATETFTYTVTDDQGETSTAQITVTIVGTNDAPVAASASVSGTEDAGVLNGTLSATDVDANAELTFSLAGSGEGDYGTILVNEDGTYTFALNEAAQSLGAGETVTETFTYQVTDDQGETSTATITVTVLGTNDAPVAASASVSGSEDAGVLAGNLTATDVDANAELSFSLVGSGEGTYGEIAVNTDGSYSFAVSEAAQSLAAGQTATETFTYTVTDDQGATSTATITVTIVGANDGPIAAAAAVSGTEDAGVLTGNLVATDVDQGADLTFSLNGAGEGQYGALTVNTDGSYSFAVSEAAQGLAVGQQATETFSYTVTDEHGETSTAQITVTITGANDGPVASSASVSGTEDTAVLTGNLTATDADANAELTFSLNGSGESQYGTLTVNADGSYSFTPNAAAQGLGEGQVAQQSFTYTVTDDQGATSQNTITVTLNGTNDGPVAEAESVSGTEDTAALTGNLTATDADANAQLTFSLNGSGDSDYGTLTVNADGTYSFVPNEAAQSLAHGQSAQQSFTYTVTDDQGATSQATITVQLTGNNDAPVAQAAMVSGSEDAPALTGNLTATDVDQGAQLTFAVDGTGEGAAGTLTINTDGSFSFVPNAEAQELAQGQVLYQSFFYTVTDEHGATSESKVTIKLTGANDAPVAQEASVSGTEDASALTGNLTATDVDNGADLSFELNGNGEGQYGTITVDADGTYSFVPNEAAQGLAQGQSVQQSFTYTVTDEHGATSQSTITVTLTGSNDAPVAQAEIVSGDEDTPVLSGDLTATDVDANAQLTFALNGDGEGQYGTLTVNADGSYSFVANEAAQSLAEGQTAQQSFTYTVTDEHGASSQNTITVTLTGNNDAPVAQAATVSGGEDAPALTGNLVATDVDQGADLTFALNGDGEGPYGSIAVNADGSYSFTPNEDAQSLAEGQSVQQSFTYTVTDEHGASSQNTITVTLTGSNDAPVAQAASIAGGEDAPFLTGNLTATDVDEGAALTFSLNGDGESDYGTISVNSDGSYSFIPNEAAQSLAEGQTAQQSFTFTVTDEHGATSTNTITVTLTGANDAPVAQAAAVTGGEDAPALTGNLTATDVDQGADLTFALNGNGQSAYGAITVAADGSYTFTPNANAQSLAEGQSAQQSFTYTVTDEHGAASEQTITVTLTGSNDAPVAQAATMTGGEDAPFLSGNLTATDVDEGAQLTFALAGDGESDYGEIVVNADGSYSFVPNEAAQGLAQGESVQQSFTYTVTDEHGASSQQTITVTLTGANDAPVAIAASATGSEDAAALTGNLAATDVDNGADLSFALNGDGESDYGTLTVNEDGSYSFVPNEDAQSLAEGQSVQQSFTFTVTDEHGAASQNTITITLTGNNDAPIAQAAAISDSEDAPVLSGNLIATDVDQGADLTFSLNGDGAGDYGTLSVNADGSYNFVPSDAAQGLAQGQTAQQSFTYTVTDEHGATSTNTITVTLTGNNDAPVAQAATVSGGEDAPSLSGNLVATDVDDGAVLTYALDGDGEADYGTMVVNADGTYSFTPNDNADTLAQGETATQTFTFTVTDQFGATSENTITVTLTGSNDGPVAQAAAVSGSEDASVLTGNLTATDVDSDTLSFALDGDGESQYGTIAVNADGSYSFTPNANAQTLAEGQVVQQSFTYTVTDDQGATSQNTITVTLTGSNDGPVAEAESVSGTEDAPALTGNLTATDVDQGADLTFSLNGDGQSQYGTLTVNADGSYSFAPNAAAQTLAEGQSAQQSFTFTVTDEHGAASQQTLTVTLTGANDAPIAQAATVSGNEDQPALTGNLTATDIDQGADLTFSLNGNGQSQYGTLTVNEDGSYSFAPNAAAQSLAQGQTVQQSFTFTATDEHGAASQQTLTVTLSGNNDAPVAQAATVSGGEDAPSLSGNLIATDVDQGAQLTYALVGNGQADYGTMVVNADGTYSFTPNDNADTLGANETATQTFTFTVSDGLGGTAQNTITVTLTGSNDGPVAQAATVSGSEDATVLTGNLTAIDPDSEALSFALNGDGQGQYGTLTVNQDGSYSFAPNAAAQTLAQGQTATQSFTYTVTDDQGATSQATITVTLTGANDAPVALKETITGTEDAGTLTGSLDATDIDQGTTLTYSLNGNGQGQYGTLTVNTDGTYSFALNPAAQGLQNGQTVTQSFTYTVADGQGGTAQNTVQVTITGSNDAPVALAEVVSGTEDATALTGSLDITDVDNATGATFALVGNNTSDYGTITVNPNGTYSFVPNANAQTLNVGESATQTFTYRVTDAQGATAENSITVTLTGTNDRPVALAEVVTGTEDAGTLTGSLDATDIDSDTLTYALSGSGSGTYGSLVVSPNGTYVFTMNAAAQGLQNGQTAVQNFSYKVTDEQGAVSVQTIQVSITGSNDAPVANAVTRTASEDTAPLTGNLTATDVDNATTSLTYSLNGNGQGQYGTLVVNPNGSYSFTPNANAQSLNVGQVGQQSFTFTVTDPQGGTSQNTITIKLNGSNDAPSAVAEVVSGTEDAGTLTGSLDATDVDSATLTYALQGTAATTYGTMTVNPNGTYSFALNNATQALQEGQTVTQTFTYKVTDTQGASSFSTITVSITGTNDAPVAQASTVSGSEDAARLTGQLSATDVDSTGLTFSASGATESQYGSIVIGSNGAYTFTPSAAAQTLAQGQTVQQTFTYQVADPQGGTSTNTITVTLTGSNDGPVAQAATKTGSEDAPSITGSLTATDVDQGAALTFSGGGSANYGTLTVAADGTYTFTPNAAAQSLQNGQTVQQNFTYTVTDQHGASSQATITINLTGSNDAPVAIAATVSGGEDSASLNGTLTATDVDSTGLTFALQGSGAGQYGTITVNADGTYSFVPNAAAQSLANGQTAQQSFNYTVTDPQGGTSTSTITVSVVGQNDAPVVQAVTKSGSEDAASLTGTLTATDAESQAVTFALNGSGQSQYGTLVVNPNGTYSFTPNAAAQALQAGQTVSQQFTYTATDTQGGVGQQTITITLNGANDAPVAQAATISGSEDASVLNGSLTATDVDSSTLTFGLVGSGAGQYGTLVVNANGTYSFTPNATAQSLAQGQSAQQSFTYSVSDGAGGITQSTITVTLTGNNDAPVAQAATLTTHEDAAIVTGNLTATDIDQGAQLTYSFAPNEDGQGDWGTLTINANGSYSFNIGAAAQGLNAGQQVTETFSYKVVDQFGATSMNTLTVTITGAADGNLIIGTNCEDNINGTSQADEIYGKAGSDDIEGRDGADTIIGGQGNDDLYGGNNNDLIYGDDRPVTGPVQPPGPTDVIFQGESAGYRNAVGSYEVDANGNITNVQFIFTNASQQGSGGSLVAGESSGTATSGSNGTFGAFIVADGYGVNNSFFNNTNLNNGRFEFRNANGTAATINSAAPALWWIPTSGSPVQLSGSVYHSAAGMEDESNTSLNPDGRIHTRATMDSAGNVQVSFEDLWNLGDEDYNDVVLKFMTGESGATLLDSNIVDEIPVLGQGTSNYDTQGGADDIYGGSGNDTVHAGAGNDYVQGDTGDDTLNGEAGDDSMYGGDGADTLDGGAGNDYLKGGTGNDTITGAIGNDKLYGEDGTDLLYGGDGTDELYGGTSNDTLYGGAGNDKLRGESGDDYLYGEDGDDDMDGGTDQDRLYGGAGADTLKGGDGDDQIYGGDGNDSIYGGTGQDLLYGGAGNDYMEGGDGDDQVYGDAGDDTLKGGYGNDRLYGGDGADRIYGGDGDDIIVGGMGADRMTGDGGNDIFLYNSAAEGGDVITDFQSGKDRFKFDGDQFDGFGNYTTQKSGNGDFNIIGQDGSKITYDASEDTLAFTPGGSSGQGYTVIATVESGTVKAEDIEII